MGFGFLKRKKDKETKPEPELDSIDKALVQLRNIEEMQHENTDLTLKMIAERDACLNALDRIVGKLRRHSKVNLTRDSLIDSLLLVMDISAQLKALEQWQVSTISVPADDFVDQNSWYQGYKTAKDELKEKMEKANGSD